MRQWALYFLHQILQQHLRFEEGGKVCPFLLRTLNHVLMVDCLIVVTDTGPTVAAECRMRRNQIAP